MPESLKQFGLRMISGEDQSTGITAARLAAAVVEPFYSGVMSLRNICYDSNIFRSCDLGKPTISVGNITTGGTGKTPVVQWLANQLRQRGRRPAILLRGYGKASISDEAQLMNTALNQNSTAIIPVQANPSRVTGAKTVLANHPKTDLFILDDAFQHRKARRDFNLVLISATQPFGFGHVLPRGLLREPLSGLGRADAFLITRCSLVSPAEIAEIDRFLAEKHPSIPVFHSDHQLAGLWLPLTNEQSPMRSLAGQKVFVTAGIGDPAAFARQISMLGCTIVGTRWFADHHSFTTADLKEVTTSAQAASASALLTTEKDWVKMKSLVTTQTTEISIGVIKLEVFFHGDDGENLINRICRSVSQH